MTTSSDDEAAGILRGVRFGLPREYFVAGMEPGVEARIREAVKLRRACKRQCIGAALKLSLQAHKACAIERQYRYANDDD